MTVETREKQITKTSVIGIIANVFLASFKALVGFIAGSIAIVLDAVNNLTDALSSIITIVGIKLAKKKPDEKHPYGHGRIEYFSAIIIAFIVLAAGAMSMVESIKKIFNPEMPDYSAATLIIVAVAVIVKILLGRYVKKQGVKLNSDALVASGADASFDAIISASTLLAAAITLIFHISVDAYFGAIISVFIIKAGLEMLGESVGSVMGTRPDSEITKNIKATIRQIPGVLGAYDLILHDYGPDKAIGSVHVEVDAAMTAEELHKLTKQIQLTIEHEFKVFLTVGIYAIDAEHDPLRDKIREEAFKKEGVLGVHGIFVDDDRKYISFDILTDFTVDRTGLEKEMRAYVQSLVGEYEVTINFDSNFSD